MAVLCRWILVLTLLLAAGPRLWAASAADRAFDAAVKAFQDTFYDRAEAQLADFCQKYPDLAAPGGSDPAPGPGAA